MDIQDIDRAIRIKVFRNGDEAFAGKDVIFSRRQIKTWEKFLQTVTEEIQSPEAVRNIRIADSGIPVSSFDQLEDKGYYVAVGYGRFKRIGYLKLLDKGPAFATLSPRIIPEVQPVRHSRLQVSGRIKKVPIDAINIFVFENGEETKPAHHIILTRKVLLDWNLVLTEINQRVKLPSCSAVKTLHQLSGETVFSPHQLQNFGYYVAVGAADFGGFKKLNYGLRKPVFTTAWNKFSHLEQSGLTIRGSHDGLGSISQDSEVSSANSSNTNKTGSSSRSFPSINKSKMAGKPRKPRRQYQIQVPLGSTDYNGDFQSLPTGNRNTGIRQLDYSVDEGGIFKAKEQRKEVMGAAEISENKNTKTDLPVDLREAEQVEEELVTSTKYNQKVKPRKAVSISSDVTTNAAIRRKNIKVKKINYKVKDREMEKVEEKTENGSDQPYQKSLLSIDDVNHRPGPDDIYYNTSVKESKSGKNDGMYVTASKQYITSVRRDSPPQILTGYHADDEDVPLKVNGGTSYLDSSNRNLARQNYNKYHNGSNVDTFNWETYNQGKQYYENANNAALTIQKSYRNYRSRKPPIV